MQSLGLVGGGGGGKGDPGMANCCLIVMLG